MLFSHFLNEHVSSLCCIKAVAATFSSVRFEQKINFGRTKVKTLTFKWHQKSIAQKKYVSEILKSSQNVFTSNVYFLGNIFALNPQTCRYKNPKHSSLQFFKACLWSERILTVFSSVL